MSKPSSWFEPGKDTLDDVLKGLYMDGHLPECEESKEALKAFMLELVGEDDRTDQNVTSRKYYRNEFREELREKIQDL